MLAVAQADEAAGILASFGPDVVVWDVGRPEGAPAGSTRSLERALSGVEVPVLLVSEHGGRSLQQRSVSRGPSDFVVKPFAPEELQTRVANVLARQLDRAELRSHVRAAAPAEERQQGTGEEPAPRTRGEGQHGAQCSGAHPRSPRRRPGSWSARRAGGGVLDSSRERG